LPSRLSFVVPIYKPRLDILTRMVKSLCDQSLKEWDATFVLDGACEAAENVIHSEMKKKPNAYKIVVQDHAGAQRARNNGQSHATGDFIVHWDYDCLIEPEVSRVWVEQFDKYPEVGFIYSGYKFLDEKGAVDAEPFDPWTLRVRNYISGCFPVRRELCATWNESLKSLQDWDFWLSVVEKGGVGKYLPGYSFSTLYPEGESISAIGCSDKNWLERIDAVKKLHNLPERRICVSSLTKRQEGIWLAKLIDADYQDIPNWKPHRYKCIIQLGFSFLPERVGTHCSIFSDNAVRKVIFWTCDDITEIHTRLNHVAIKKYSILLNSMIGLEQYVEDKTSYDMMKEVGFNVEIKPLPLAVGDVKPLPSKPRFAVDIDRNYGPIFNVLEKSLPDVELVMLSGAMKLEDFTGLAHFHPDRTISIGMKRAVIAGRHVVSNVQAPFMGFVDDTVNLSEFIPAAVESIRELAFKDQDLSGRDYYKTASKEGV
jgi:glycosyltransferase involved in cell wall biosynthesis